MRRLWWSLLVVAVVGGFVLGSFGTASSQAPQERVTLTWFDPNATDWEKEIDETKQGFNPGDWVLIRDKFLDPETCEIAGRFLLRFTVMKFLGRQDANFLLDGGAILPDGKLTIYWPGRFGEFGGAGGEGAGGAITGGTGAYRDASGQITTQEDVELCGKNGSTLTVSLVLGR